MASSPEHSRASQARAASVQRRQSRSQRLLHCHREDFHPEYEYTNLEDLLEKFGALAEEAVVRSTTVLHPAEFPTNAIPNRMPYPVVLNKHTLHIHALQLQIRISPASSVQYPTKIFSVQDNIANILARVPNLKILKLDIDYISSKGRYYDEVEWMTRGVKSFVSFQSLLEGLVLSLRNVDLGHRSISYWDSVHRWDQDVPRRGWTVEDCINPDRLQEDVGLWDEKAVVSAMLEKRGTEFVL